MAFFKVWIVNAVIQSNLRPTKIHFYDLKNNKNQFNFVSFGRHFELVRLIVWNLWHKIIFTKGVLIELDLSFISRSEMYSAKSYANIDPVGR